MPVDLPALIMKRIRQLGFLRVALIPEGADEAERGRIMHLFRNRAELKKAYGSVQDELQRMRDRIKQQEGATARVQEMLQALEERLSAPHSGYPAMVFYQLRHLWVTGRKLLELFLNELVAQQEERERRQFLAEHNRQQFSRRQAVETEFLLAQQKAASARAEAHEFERKLAALNRPWHYFRRRAARQELQAATLQAMLSEQDLEASRATRESVAAEPVPEFPGLSIEARRLINLATIAYGQVLCDRLERTGLLENAREASARREPPAESYGDRAACEQLMADIQRASLLLQQRTTLQQEIRDQVEVFKTRARYRASSDTLPTPESLSVAENGRGSRVLLEDSWEIYRLLLR